MVIRRKKPAATEASEASVEADAQAMTPEGEVASAPKKKRVIRKKKAVAPTEDASAAVAIPLQPHPTIPVIPKFAAPVMPPASVMPVNMKVEPMSDDLDHLEEPPVMPVKSLPVSEDSADRPWRPMAKKEDNLALPPKVLQAPRKYPKLEVEDILEEPERAPGYNPAHDFVRPQVRAGLFRKVGIGFALVALAVLVFVGYVMYAHATVIIHAKPEMVNIQRVVAVAAQPGDGEVGGQILEVTVAGEKTGVPGVAPTSEAPALAPAVDANVIYVGTATLFNKTTAAVTLVPTTRLLTSDGVLFRMKDRATIPAGGTAKVAIYADKPGATGAIGPSSFTIPGLPADKQKVVYATSDTATVPGDKNGGATVPAATATSNAPLVTAESIAIIETALHEELVAQAKTELQKDETGEWTGQTYLIETMTRFVSAAPGEHAASITVRLTLRVREVRFDRQKAIESAQADLKRQLSSDRELTNVTSAAEDVVEEADPKTGKASVRLTLSGDSTLPVGSPLFDAEKLRGLDIGAVQAYFANIKGVDRVDIIFVPPWPRRMPDLKDHIKFEIQP